MKKFKVSIYFCRVSVGLKSAFWSTDHLSILIVPVSTRWLHFYLLCPSAVDEEAFEDNAEEYIRRDIEGSGDHFTHSIHPEIPFADKLLISLTQLPCFILMIKFDIRPSFSKDTVCRCGHSPPCGLRPCAQLVSLLRGSCHGDIFGLRGFNARGVCQRTCACVEAQRHRHLLGYIARLQSTNTQGNNDQAASFWRCLCTPDYCALLKSHRFLITWSH